MRRPCGRPPNNVTSTTALQLRRRPSRLPCQPWRAFQFALRISPSFSLSVSAAPHTFRESKKTTPSKLEFPSKHLTFPSIWLAPEHRIQRLRLLIGVLQNVKEMLYHSFDRASSQSLLSQQSSRPQDIIYGRDLPKQLRANVRCRRPVKLMCQSGVLNGKTDIVSFNRKHLPPP